MANIESKVGELIENRYRVLDEVDKGGMGTLYRVSDETQAGKIVALKMVRLKDASQVHKRVEHFQREFRLLTQLYHPNLVSVHDYGITTERQLYFTMDWIEGQDLEPHGCRLNVETSIAIIVQICRALAYLHSRGVVHGDLKPGNVLLVDTRVKLVDFGVALEMRSPKTLTHYYSPGYSAPEMKESRPLDHRADLYSLGALWYALLMGEPPLFILAPEQMIRFSLHEALEGHDLANIGGAIIKLLSSSPDERYTSADEVIEVINQVTKSDYQLETEETASSYALRTQFVNREAELEVLDELWKQAQSDEGKLVLISGGNGVGKSRLIRELEVPAELAGARVVWGQCVERGGRAYHPWREALRVLARYVEVADKGMMQQIGPVLATLLPELWEREYMASRSSSAEIEAQAAQLRLNNAIVSIMRAAASLRPTMIVIENVHWADEATLEMLGFLARIPMPKGLLVCVTYRSDEISPGNPLLSLSGEQVQRIPLQTLSFEVTADLVCSMLGLEQAPSLLMERVQQTTEGNAFFVQELIRSLAAEGKVLRRTMRGWEVDGEALRKAQLPESIRQVVRRRLGQLSAEGQQVLRWAAVMGIVFWEGGVAEVGQVTWQQVRVALSEGMEQKLVVMRDETSFAGEREYLFFNPIVQEVSYESVSRDERREFHSRVAAWLLIRSGKRAGEHLSLIADHMEDAGQAEQAVAYLHRAGEQAAAQFANAEAITHFGRALALTSQDALSKRHALLLSREKVYDVQGMRQAQARDLATLEELAHTLDDDRRRAKVALRQAHYADVTGDYPAAITAAQTAIRLVQAAGDIYQEAAGYQQWGTALWHQGSFGDAREQLNRALALAQVAVVRKVEADCLHSLHVVSWFEGDYGNSRRFVEQALHIYREIGARQGECQTLSGIGHLFISQGNYAKARVYYEQTLHICCEIGDRQGESAALNDLGSVALRQGDYDSQRTHCEQALRIYREIGDRRGEGIVLDSLSLNFHQKGDDEAAQEYAQQALRLAQDLGIYYLQGYAWTHLGHALAGLGHLTKAANAYRQALDIRHESGKSSLAIESLAGLVRVSLAQGNLALAQTEEILAYLEDNSLDGTEESLRTYLTCYQALQVNDAPRAQSILNVAHRMLQEQAAEITDQSLRRSFLENVPYHREIVREFSRNELA